MSEKFKIIKPEVNPEAEFFEILNDFSDPLEVLREAISNSIDWGASFLRISISIETIEGERSLVLKFIDDGFGMTKEIIEKDFWGLGFSRSRDDVNKIGEKGHGTKIYLRSRKVHVFTQTEDSAFEAICEKPLANLSQQKIHVPQVRTTERKPEINSGTEITIFGYNENESSKFVQSIVKDYILWFTKVGSIEKEFGNEVLKDFKIHLNCIDSDEFETISFGHVFPEENTDIEELFNEYGSDAADKFVKRYLKQGRLVNHPEVTFDAVVYIEGNDAKRAYNPMIRKRRDDKHGTYKVSDRYGIYLCKDFIPVQRVNEWISGFGSGSNAFVLLHGFVNCQNFKLTANRGNISNTDPQILKELENEVKNFIDEIDKDLKGKSLYILRNWQDEQRTLSQEKSDFESRVKIIKKKKFAVIDGQRIAEPDSESELFATFMRLYTLNPDLFDFEPIDYNTTRGIDIIAQTNEEDRLAEGEYGYVELKHILKNNFNHGFKYLKWIVCWDLHQNIKRGTKFTSIDENDERELVITEDDEGQSLYFLEHKTKRMKIQIVRLKEFIDNKLNLKFE